MPRHSASDASGGVPFARDRATATVRRVTRRFVARYVFFVAGANLVWEAMHAPLYTLWRTNSVLEIATDIALCGMGDIVIAVAALAAARLVWYRQDWPRSGFDPVAGTTVIVGLLATLAIEWSSVNLWNRWDYAEYMPTIPALNVGLSPILQWIFIPAVSFWWASRRLTERWRPKARPARGA